MPNRKVWEVDIDVVGPISVSRDISFKQEKGFSTDRFYSDIKLCNSEKGICATVTAYADNSDIAKTAAFVFFGRMADVLSLDNDIPLILLEHDRNNGHLIKATTRRSLEKEDFIAVFNVARKLEIEHPRLLKAIGWYSKGKISINKLDSFLSYWNAIEIIATKYYTETDRTKEGTINKAYQCFIDYFGELNSWKLPVRWLDNTYAKRNLIAHGAEETTVEAINDVAILIPTLEKTSRELIYAVLNKQYEENIFEQETWQALF